MARPANTIAVLRGKSSATVPFLQRFCSLFGNSGNSVSHIILFSVFSLLSDTKQVLPHLFFSISTIFLCRFNNQQWKLAPLEKSFRNTADQPVGDSSTPVSCECYQVIAF